MLRTGTNTQEKDIYLISHTVLHYIWSTVCRCLCKIFEAGPKWLAGRGPMNVLFNRPISDGVYGGWANSRAAGFHFKSRRLNGRAEAQTQKQRSPHHAGIITAYWSFIYSICLYIYKRRRCQCSGGIDPD